MQFTSIYLSRFLGNKVYSEKKEVLGVLKDVGVSLDSQNPKVAVAKVKKGNTTKYLDWNYIQIEEANDKYLLTCIQEVEASIDKLLFLKKLVLDNKIIDVNGRKVVRVNDIRLVLLSFGFYVAAVDIGLEGLLRRLGIAKLLKRIGLKIPGKLMLWDNVATVYPVQNIELSKTYDKLNTLHPSDLADIIEDFNPKTGMIIFSGLDNTKAADVLEELEEDAQKTVLNHLSPDKVADILEEMPPDEVADILDGINPQKAEELLNNMDSEASAQVRELLEYEDNEIGSLMSTDYLSYSSDSTVEAIIKGLKQLHPEEELMYCLYVVSKHNKLVGTLTLSDLIFSDPSTKVKNIMNKHFIYMIDTEKISDLYKEIAKYNLLSMPITDKDKKLVGNVIVTDVAYELLKLARK
jgi:CBS domain-containing protein/sporulation protein YlmC with PRC-barrel domain